MSMFCAKLSKRSYIIRKAESNDKKTYLNFRCNPDRMFAKYEVLEINNRGKITMLKSHDSTFYVLDNIVWIGMKYVYLKIRYGCHRIENDGRWL